MKTARTYEELKSRLDEMSDKTAEKQADVLSGFLFEPGELERLDTEWSDTRFQPLLITSQLTTMAALYSPSATAARRR